MSSPHEPQERADIPTVPDYEILGITGRGAYGTVWVARDRSGVLRALKVVDLTRLPDHDAGEREERALALVRQRVPRHPHLVEIFHVSRQDGRLVYAMELADAAAGSPPPGEDGYQADPLARRIAVNGRLSVVEAVRVAIDLLSALEALHAAKLVHRDVKPANVIFVGGIPKLADIGLAAVAQTALSVAGTPGFLPLDGSTGPDADLYGLGKLLYQSVTGLPPSDFPTVPAEVFNGLDAELVRRLNRVLLRACAKTKAERFSCASDLREALERVLASRQTRTQALIGTAVAGVLLVGTACGFWLARSEEGPKPDTLAPPSSKSVLSAAPMT
jgi:serine/threonine protein kinase